MIDNIPNAPVPYDSDDAGHSYFIDGTGGVVAAPVINLKIINLSSKANASDWQAAYTPSNYAFTSATFRSYVKARKENQAITLTDLSEITASGIYIYTGDLTFTSLPAALNNYNVVLIVSGAVNINMAAFIPTKSVAILADTINFDPTTTTADGIFIANTVTTGSTTAQGLKINGNLIAQSLLTNGRKQTNPNQPSLFIVFKPQMYLDLLPYLSVANYDWQQTQ